MFGTVLQQVLILFVLIGCGWALSKAKVINDDGASALSTVALTFATPCVIIKSFIREYTAETMRMVLRSFLAAILVHALFIGASYLVCRDRDQKRQRVLRFGIIFSNCGFMSLPLQEALLGADGVLYGASFVAIFNLLVWSYGLAVMCGDRHAITPKKLILNPGIIGFTVGLLVFVFSIPLPTVVYKPIEYLAALNTPLPMIIIGYHLGKTNPLTAFSDLKCVWAIVLRLVLLPLAAFGLLYLCGIRGILLTSMMIASCAPTAAITTMFSHKYGQATDLSVKMVSLSTLFSILTIPLLVTFARWIA